ncbi:MAG: tetratricopeptide repeat protein, partial [Planctomycetaceae bacterium]|nr:tetratricopeptide repeat protein [Planctomycetaceae bacterium]
MDKETLSDAEIPAGSPGIPGAALPFDSDLPFPQPRNGSLPLQIDAEGASPGDGPRSEEPGPFNFRLAILLTVLAACAALAIRSVHDFQVSLLAADLRGTLLQADESDSPEYRELLERYVRFAPDDIDQRTRLATILDESAETEYERREALRMLQSVLREQPDLIDFRKRMAEQMFALGMVRDAAPEYERLSRSSVGDAFFSYRLGNCYETDKRPLEAAAAYERAVESDPTDVRAYERLARLLRDQLNQPAEADRVITKLIAVNRQSAEAFVVRSRFLSEGGRSADALADSRQAFLLAPHDRAVVTHRVRSLLELTPGPSESELTDVMSHVDRMLREDPSDPELLLCTALAEFHFRNNPSAAESALRRALKNPECTAEAAVLLVETLIAQDRTADAIAGNAALERSGLPQPVVQYLQALIDLNSGNYLSAVDSLEQLAGKVSARDPLAGQIHLQIARCRDYLGQADHCRKSLETAADLSPRSAEIALELARVLARSGRIREAFDRVLPFRDDPRAALAAVDLIRLQNLSRPEVARDWDEAAGFLQTGQQSLGDIPPVIVRRAQLLCDRGRTGSGLELMREACERDPGNTELRAAWAALTAAQGRLKDAGEILRDHPGERSSADLLIAELKLIGMDHNNVEIPVSRLAAIETEAAGLPIAASISALAVLAETFSAKEQNHSAARVLQRVVQQVDHIGYWLRLIELSGQLGKDFDVSAVAVSAVRRIEGSDGPYTVLAETMSEILVTGVPAETDRLSELRGTLHLLLEQLPDSPIPQLLLARIAEHRGDRQEAIRHYFQAIERGDRRADLIRRLAELLVKSDRIDEARTVLRIHLQSH